MRRTIQTVTRVALLGLLVLLLTLAGRTLFVLSGPRPDDRDLAAQALFLEDAVASGAARQAQQLFPEGEYFVTVLAGLVTASDTTRSAQVRATIVDRRLAELGRERVLSRFGNPGGLEHGIFARGWRLLLMVERHRLGPGGPDAEAVRADAKTILTAIAATPEGFAQAYRGQAWPVDTVVALAAVARADAAVGVPGARQALAAWLARTRPVRDGLGGLLPHQVDPAGGTITGPRGSSSALIATFWPDVDPAGADAMWAAFHGAFVTREAGLVGVREHPHGEGGRGDIDSGPLVLGVSLSASAVTLGAARRAGAHTLTVALDQEAEVFGLPFTWSGKRSYAGGILPVGDAFVAWARTWPERPAPASADGPGHHLGALGVAAPTVLALLCLGFLLRRPRRADPPPR